MHEETQKIRDCVEGQKVGEKCASETGTKLKRVAKKTGSKLKRAAKKAAAATGIA
jgi:predicted DNA binding CopG/RHH family protein